MLQREKWAKRIFVISTFLLAFCTVGLRIFSTSESKMNIAGAILILVFLSIWFPIYIILLKDARKGNAQT